MENKLKYQRRKTSTTHVGGLCIGSDYPIRIQTMANTSTDDIEGSVAQARRCFAAGAELLRFTTQGTQQVESLSKIHQALKNPQFPNCPQAPESPQASERSLQLTTYNLPLTTYNLPLVADVHFRSEVADAAARVVEKVRINPGNYIDPARTFKQLEYTDEEYAAELQRLSDRFTAFLNICKEHKTAIRIGVNHGSLSDRIMSRYGDTPAGIAESCMEFLRVAKAENFEDIVISVKASNTRVMVESVLLLVEAMDKEDMHYPLHLGVTEAGEGEDGRIKSAVGIGALLAAGIGDTIRVSLSEAPENELPVARALVDYFSNPESPRYTGIPCADRDLHKLHVAAEAGYEILVLHHEWSYPEDKTLEADILQAARVRMYKTEYISCPGCGRTMFALEETIARIKNAISSVDDPALKERLSHLKIGIMGCIVNGPGEMADADYGYVGAGRDKISLYKNKVCIEKNLPQEEAVERLLDFIRNDC